MKISLVSIGFKIFSIFLTFAIGVFTYVIIFLIDDKNIFLSTFVLLVFVFCLFSVYIAFSYKIILYERYLVFQRPFRKTIDYKEIKKIYSDCDPVESSIYIQLESSQVRISGFMVLFNKKKGMKKTQEVTKEIINYIDLNYPNHNNKNIAAFLR
jgi:hypothetical protein